MELSPVQVRVLGCLVEKQRTTPDNYPLTMNALLAACNQTTNRYPVVTFTEAAVGSAVENLRAANLLRVDYKRGHRAEKYRHVLHQALAVGDDELAVLAVLMLRGPQTAAEVRGRVERLRPFAGQDEVDSVLAALAAREPALAVRLPPAPGQKEPRWAHLLAGEVSPELAALPMTPARTSTAERIDDLESRITVLGKELDRLRSDHDALAAKLADLVD